MKNSYMEQEERRKKLIEEFAHSKKNEKLQELHSDISIAVGFAIGTINDITAPFILSVLELYKKSVSEKFPNAVPMADFLMRTAEANEVIYKELLTQEGIRDEN